MEHIHFFIEIGIVLVVTLLGGLIARGFRMPVLIGYLLAGIAIGPYTPGFMADQETINVIANLGVALLMFAVGVQFSLKELGAVRRTALLGGTLQIFGTIALGVALGVGLGWGTYGGVFLGCALALSSTAVMMRILEERGELGTAHGGVMMGILIIQDLSLVLMVSVLPALAPGGLTPMETFWQVNFALGKAIAFIGLTLFFATRLMPLLLGRIIKTGSAELFLLTIVCLCLGAAALAELSGLGLAIGAFLAGVVVSESPYSHEVFAQIRPLRDVFSALFFVSVGMLLNPQFVFSNLGTVGSVVLAILLGKTLITFMAIYACGWHGRTSLLTAIGLAQIGEFSFVLAVMGSDQKLIPREVTDVVLSSALITLLASPFLYTAAPTIYKFLDRVPFLFRFFNRQRGGEAPIVKRVPPKTRVLILGAGRVGRYVSDAMRAMQVSHVVVDYDSIAIERMKNSDVPIIYGDASSMDVLMKAHPEHKELAVVALPEVGVTEAAVMLLRRLHPGLIIAARVRRGIDIPKMRHAGADVVIHGEFESGVVMIRQSLRRLGFDIGDIDKYIDDVREYRYRNEEE